MIDIEKTKKEIVIALMPLNPQKIIRVCVQRHR